MHDILNSCSSACRVPSRTVKDQSDMQLKLTLVELEHRAHQKTLFEVILCVLWHTRKASFLAPFNPCTPSRASPRVHSKDQVHPRRS
jgi:hypothetical protein